MITAFGLSGCLPLGFLSGGDGLLPSRDQTCVGPKSRSYNALLCM